MIANLRSNPFFVSFLGLVPVRKFGFSFSFHHVSLEMVKTVEARGGGVLLSTGVSLSLGGHYDR